jgi:hypothetical protein
MSDGMKVRFEDHSEKVAGALHEALVNCLEEGAYLIESAAAKLTRVDSGQLKGSWGHTLNEGKLEAQIGNTQENAIWEEYGTGEHALEGNGRKDAWYVAPENLSPKYRALFPNGFSTHGKKPQRMLYHAFRNNKKTVVVRYKEILKSFKDGDGK